MFYQFPDVPLPKVEFRGVAGRSDALLEVYPGEPDVLHPIVYRHDKTSEFEQAESAGFWIQVSDAIDIACLAAAAFLNDEQVQILRRTMKDAALRSIWSSWQKFATQ